MERLCFVLEVNEGEEERYDRVHQQMPPEVRQALLECGYENYTIFRHGNLVIGYSECEPDVETVLARQRSSPVFAEWATAMTGVAKKGLEVLEPVWRL
ncbi:MAG TPA: L-rhamnose mutarotase [Acidimicrobiales bacterium]|nr:L-rhamnose mutarotase [Acidimicrobiales bacterium]